jgi:E3 ubiquitin-protein ligase HERC2
VGVDISDVSCGYKHSMALSKLGHVYTWGKGKHGRLGHDDASNKLSPARVAPQAFGGRRVVGISAGGHHSAAVAAGGAVFTWGLNDNAQLGLGEPRGGANGINVRRRQRGVWGGGARRLPGPAPHPTPPPPPHSTTPAAPHFHPTPTTHPHP